MIFGQQRDRIRRVFVDAWRKHLEGAPLEPLERSIVAVIDAHPEYQPAMTDPDALGRDYAVGEGAESNPFLHMGLHITIVEQITADRPSGIRAIYDRLRHRYGDAHELEHAMMRCLSESLAQAQALGSPPDEQKYLGCVRRLEKRML